MTHAPIAGKPSVVKPVDITFSPGPCVFDFVVSEWTKHMSSTSSPRWGSRSEVLLPLCPAGGTARAAPGQVAVLPLERDEPLVPRHRLAVVTDQVRLVIERIDMAERPGAEDDQDVLRPRLEVRGPRVSGAGSGRSRAGSAPLRRRGGDPRPASRRSRCRRARRTSGRGSRGDRAAGGRSATVGGRACRSLRGMGRRSRDESGIHSCSAGPGRPARARDRGRARRAGPPRRRSAAGRAPAGRRGRRGRRRAVPPRPGPDRRRRAAWRLTKPLFQRLNAWIGVIDWVRFGVIWPASGQSKAPKTSTACIRILVA